MIHYDEPHLTLHWEPEHNIIRAEWKDDVPGGPMREGLEAGLALIREKQARKWLVDSRRLGAIDPVDVKWVNDSWIPRAVDAGVSWMAFVQSRKVVMQMAIKSFMARINQRDLGIAYFENLDGARAWMNEQA